MPHTRIRLSGVLLCLGASAVQFVAEASEVLDQRFIGRWAHGEAHASADFSAASERFVQFLADGTYSFISGRTAGGETARGYWRAADKVLYVTEGSPDGWIAYGRYGFTDDGSAMMLTFDNGEQELWQRR
jgi:hypothetical protein